MLTVGTIVSPNTGIHLPLILATDPPSAVARSRVVGCIWLSRMSCVLCGLASMSAADILLCQAGWRSDVLLT